MTVHVGDVLRDVGCPLVEVAADEELRSVAQLMAFAGLPAVLQVAPCGRPVRLLSERCLVHALAAGARVMSHERPPVPICAPGDALGDVVEAMRRSCLEAMLVEHERGRIAILTLDAVCAFLARRQEASPVVTRDRMR